MINKLNAIWNVTWLFLIQRITTKRLKLLRTCEGYWILLHALRNSESPNVTYQAQIRSPRKMEKPKIITRAVWVHRLHRMERLGSGHRRRRCRRRRSRIMSVWWRFTRRRSCRNFTSFFRFLISLHRFYVSFYLSFSSFFSCFFVRWSWKFEIGDFFFSFQIWRNVNWRMKMIDAKEVTFNFRFNFFSSSSLHYFSFITSEM